MKKRITITEIALKADTSIATVSRAINPQTAHLVKRSTRKRILSIVKQAGFLPNPVAQRLATGRSTHIVVFLGSRYDSIFYHDYYIKLISGVMEVLERSPYDLIVRMLKLKEVHCSVADQMRGMDIAGAIVCDFVGVLEASLNGIEEFDTPLVVLNRVEKNPRASYVICDNLKSAYEATNYLLDLGHRRIAIIKGVSSEQDTIDRLDGYKKALEQRSVSLRDEFIFSGSYATETGVRAVRKFMRLKERPTALFCTNDEIAIGAIEEMVRMGISCPQEISVVGFDGIDAGRYFAPRLTTMRQPIYEMAKRAAQIIINALQGKEDLGKTQVFDAQLWKGNSCAAVKRIIRGRKTIPWQNASGTLLAGEELLRDTISERR